MEKQEIRDMLEKLHKELSSGTEKNSIDDASKALLSSVQEDIENILDSAGSASSEEHHESLTEKLTDAIEAFEDSHPDLVIVMKHVLDSLANMGF
ncbi:conserved hypothetical protein [Chloroherpeton thalassium ATCC 35110]|uniref:DUF4404 domain-containing protein n=1 Tax=Chloroherpeton thalassium (strain ATCC 35110 / GB-78) TaxID=517418 RepID=B3QW02_CHLT3|nr:DUF4404 family protein [Chloroherpeton thalassium]ACF14656.1 conserved hypothetical protein [Chloroherpeton thalassium ATCC 35110]